MRKIHSCVYGSCVFAVALNHQKPYLLRSASLQRQLELVAVATFAVDLTGRVPVKVSIGYPVEFIVEFEFYLHGARGTVKSGFCTVEENYRAEII